MHSILSFFVRQKKLALVFTVSVIALGLLALNNIQRDQFPVVDFEVMNISTNYPGASPEDVEKNITNLIEDELNDILGIDKFVSTSQEGRSNIVVTLSQDIKDVDSVKQDIRNALNRVKSLPVEVVDLPRVMDQKTSRKSIIKVNIGAPGLSYAALRKVIDNIADSIEQVSGVSEVIKEGYLDKEIKIQIKPEKLEQYKLSLPQVIDAISARNKRYTVGKNNSKTDEKNIVVLASFDALDSVGEVIVKSTFQGVVVRLKDIAVIEQGNVEEKSIIRVNGKKGFILRVRKQEQADVITTVDLVKAKMQVLNAKYDNQLQIFYSSDLSKYVRNRLKIVTNNGIIGLILVLIVLSVFLSFKTAFWVSVSLPVSLLGTVALLGAFGETINLVSLAAMILVLGIVVDDSIIVAESIHHYKQTKQSNYDAVVQGFKRVIMPVITTIFTTILAFSSMFLMGGVMGKFIYIIPVVVIFALTLSFLEVSIALPAHLATTTEKSRDRNWFNAVESWFERFLSTVLEWRYWVISMFALLLVGSLFFAKNNMTFVLFPAIGVDTINAKLQMPAGSSLAYTELASKQIETLVQEVVGEDLESITTDVGKNFTNYARFVIELVPSSEREQTSKSLLKQLKSRASEIVSTGKSGTAEKFDFFIKRPGPPQGEDIEINLVGPNDIERQAAADALEKILLSIKGLDNINRDDEPGKPRVEVVLDFEKMARLEVDFSVLSQYLRTAFTGIDITDIREGDADVNFRIYLGDGKHSQDFIQTLKVNNRKGYLVPLAQFSNIRQIAGEPNFNHFNAQRSILLSGSVDDELNTASTVINTALKRLDLANNFPNTRLILQGGAKDTAQSLDSFKQAFIMAVFGIFLLLVLLFNSYSQPLLVVSAVPFSVIGVIWAFFLHGEPLSFFAILGTLALIGVIVNDALVLVSHLNYLKRSNTGTSAKDYGFVIQGAKERLRAVVITTLTTLAGIIPLAYGIGGTDFILKPMALSLGYGLLFGTVLTLVLLPCLYLVNNDIIRWIQTRSTIIRNKIKQKSL